MASSESRRMGVPVAVEYRVPGAVSGSCANPSSPIRIKSIDSAFLAEIRSLLFSNHLYNTGSTNNVSRVAVTRPPMTTVA
ncbi:MAG: hypothetical protein MUE58_06560, partial [Chitinophagaceae bacterium]|nr:hypothetical protein [Chitinophagaceae bacterium]